MIDQCHFCELHVLTKVLYTEIAVGFNFTARPTTCSRRNWQRSTPLSPARRARARLRANSRALGCCTSLPKRRAATVVSSVVLATAVDRASQAHVCTTMAELAKVPSALAHRVNYTRYVEMQVNKFDRQSKLSDVLSADGTLNQTFAELRTKKHDLGGANERRIIFLSALIARHLPLVKHFALCHGTNLGLEQIWFRRHLPVPTEVWGTELAPRTAKLSKWTVNWDFHVVKSEWRGRADFVYSNALDHSPDPQQAIAAWMEEIAPGGALIIEWGHKHVYGHSETDPFSASYASMKSQLQKWSAHSRRACSPAERSCTFRDRAFVHSKTWTNKQEMANLVFGFKNGTGLHGFKAKRSYTSFMQNEYREWYVLKHAQ